jgi:hypothetical protein
MSECGGQWRGVEGMEAPLSLATWDFGADQQGSTPSTPSTLSTLINKRNNTLSLEEERNDRQASSDIGST